MTTLMQTTRAEVLSDIAARYGVNTDDVTLTSAGHEGADIYASFRLMDGRSGHYRFIANCGQTRIHARPTGAE